ncbi:MAG: CYTH domain-containing protein [Solirubrobacterales bacterium]|nr:CYTH domain-containing protein [Solirubrobacterales bacterium]
MTAPGVEIERKFLVDALPPELDGVPSRRIQQGYLAVAPDGVEVRLRREDDHVELTIKSGPAMVRVEEHVAVDARQFEALWPLTEGRRLSKTRHLVPLGDGLTAEVDVYDDALDGLLTAEVEFPSAQASEAFTPPPWLGAEVTGDKRYANQSLATAGRP